MKTGIDKLRYVFATLCVIVVLIFKAGEATSRHAKSMNKQTSTSVYQKMRQKMMRFGLFGNQILLGAVKQK